MDVLQAREPADTGPRTAPALEVLLDGSRGDRVGAVRIRLPAGTSLPEHDHGASAAVVVPLTGQVALRSGTQRVELVPGALARLGVGERVGVDNPGVAEAVLVVLFAPPDFVHTLARQPPAPAAAGEHGEA